MRVAYFTRDFSPHDYRFLTSLAESGQEVFFLRLERSGRALDDRALPSSVQQVRWRGGQQTFRWRDTPALVLDLQRVLREIQPDVLHAGPVQGPAFLGALTGFQPLVTMSWGSDLLKDAYRNSLYQRITRFTLRRSAVVLGDCDSVRQAAVSFGANPERIVIFPWGIDLTRFTPSLSGAPSALRQRLGWQDCFVVLSLRSWEPIYGIDVLLRGFAEAAQQDSDLRLLLLGSGSLSGMVHQIIQQYDLAERVYLGGQVNQDALPGIYHAADLYVSASHSDGSSVSLMEAMGSALPVLVSAIPANREWVREGVQGWLFPDGDSHALAEGILRAARQRSDLGPLRKAARAAAEQRADWNKNFAMLLRAYQMAQQGVLPHDQPV